MRSSTPVPLKDIVFTDFDGGEAIIVDLSTKQYYRLNETAALIWRGLEKGEPIEKIVSEMQALYEVSSEQALASVNRFLSNLEASSLVRASS
jgi:hypothetical protein